MLRQMGIHIESLAIIESLDNCMIKLKGVESNGEGNNRHNVK